MHLNKQSDEIITGVDKSSFIETARMINSSGTTSEHLVVVDPTQRMATSIVTDDVSGTETGAAPPTPNISKHAEASMPGVRLTNKVALTMVRNR